MSFVARITGVVVVVVCSLASAPSVQAQAAESLSGTWAFDHDASQIPREIGFPANFVPTHPDAPAQGGRGGRRSAAPEPALRPHGDSYEDSQRRQLLTEAVRNPPVRVTIVDTPETVTVTDENGNSRRFHPDGRAETLELGTTPLLTTARREEGKLVVLYSVADLRQLRYSYSRADPTQLFVDVQFIERGVAGDTVRLIYRTPTEPGKAAPTSTASRSSSVGPPSAPGAPPAAMPRGGSEFSGLSRIGVVVEDLGQQAIGCGLTRDGLEAAASKPFTDAGVKVARNSDEDTYVHVTVMTSTLPNGMCISRYDWSIYAMTDATLSYQHKPLLVQVLLAHKGGLTGSMPAAHPADVIRGMTDGLTQIAGIIHDANR